ncbi:MerR family transcriptional regulator [Phosphitispora sp. TUW77]|uniref:MerR family transcriptional regulator n=1 Tax=Phosphitispora sp. TUW77 TaxID=3152361 RepID=UPI003AB1A77B
MRINEFAQKTGLTVKTLLHFDMIGLLKPIKEDSGYMLYCDEDFLKVQQILTLSYMGLSLE